MRKPTETELKARIAMLETEAMAHEQERDALRTSLRMAQEGLHRTDCVKQGICCDECTSARVALTWRERREKPTETSSESGLH